MDRNTDPLDAASQLEMATNDRAIKLHANRYQPEAEFNSNGDKVCIDCEDIIPRQRAEIPGIVRCLVCQGIEENYYLRTGRKH